MINAKLLKAAERQALENGEADNAEEMIDWTSASTMAGGIRAQLADRGDGGAVMPPEMRDELFGSSEIAASSPSKHAPQRKSTSARQDDELPAIPLDESFLGKMEAGVSKRALLIVSAVSLIALVATLVAGNSVINSFDEGETPNLPGPSLRVATLSGVWVGLDRSQNSQGVPVAYLFTRPDWLLVTEPSATAGNGSPLVVAQANYTLANGKMDARTIQATNSALIPAVSSISITGNKAVIGDSAGGSGSGIVLSRPELIQGKWQASGGGTYAFSNGTVTVSSQGAKQTGAYELAGNVLRVTPSAGAPGAGTAQTWLFTFDNGDLLLYLPDPNNPAAAPNFSAPLRLTHAR